jgi:hypothetical protein
MTSRLPYRWSVLRDEFVLFTVESVRRYSLHS